MQQAGVLEDGNLALLENGTTVLWSTKVTGWPNSSAAIDANGRFAAHNQNGEETYVIDTRRAGTVLQLRPDGHLLLIHGPDLALRVSRG